MINAATQAVPWTQRELVVPGPQVTSDQRFGQGTDERVLVFVGVRDEDVELDGPAVIIIARAGWRHAAVYADAPLGHWPAPAPLRKSVEVVVITLRSTTYNPRSRSAGRLRPR